MGNDSKHFEDYREQTRVKHEILSAYLPAFFTILGSRHKNLVFIDGFAGPGTYKESETGTSHNGSPIRALEVIGESFRHTLQSMMHSRVSYPGEKSERHESQTPTRSSSGIVPPMSAA